MVKSFNLNRVKERKRERETVPDGVKKEMRIMKWVEGTGGVTAGLEISFKIFQLVAAG